MFDHVSKKIIIFVSQISTALSMLINICDNSSSGEFVGWGKNDPKFFSRGSAVDSYGSSIHGPC